MLLAANIATKRFPFFVHILNSHYFVERKQQNLFQTDFVSDRIKLVPDRAIPLDVLDAEAITEEAVGPPAINKNQSIETKMSIMYNSSQRSQVKLTTAAQCLTPNSILNPSR